MKIIFRTFTFFLLAVLVSCSLESDHDLVEPTSDTKQSESFNRMQRICNFGYPFTSDQSLLKIKIEYAPLATRNFFTNITTYDYETRRTSIRNSILVIDPTVSFERLDEKKDLLITTSAGLQNFEFFLCSAYLNFEINEAIKSTIVEVCFNSGVSESHKQTVRDLFITDFDLEFIKDINGDCEIWVFKGCCRTTTVGGGGTDGEYTWTDLNFEQT